MWRKSRKLANSETSAFGFEKECNKHVKQSLGVRYSIEKNFEKLCGFQLQDLSSFERFTLLLYRPTDPASLGVVRALFGLCMVLDVVEERGLADIDIKWGEPLDCHFPLIHGMKPPPLAWITVIYAVMWMGAFGIMLGLHFKLACACFVFPYWYIFLLDKSYWNNHTYLYGIVTTLLWGTEANKYFALDVIKENGGSNSVPLWNYFIVKFQFFALYFLAGLKKSSAEWLSGYAMTNLSRHWVFSPFKLFLTTEQTDFFIVHWFAFIFDLTVGFWMLFERTRIPAMVFCTAFHLMNSRLFNIGMFPYVCLATMPLFCNVDWPRRFSSSLKRASFFSQNEATTSCVESSTKSTDTRKEGSTKKLIDEPSSQERNESSCDEGNTDAETVSSIEAKNEQESIRNACKGVRGTRLKSTGATKQQKLVVSLLLFHVVLQFFLPYSHFITKGYNNWVPGLYGYSWDMMVHAWDTILVVIKVHDNVSNEDRYLDPKAWVASDRWEKHGDMARQYAFCLKDNLIEQEKHIFKRDLQYQPRTKWTRLSTNLSIYIDVWCSLNGRFQQRMFDPTVDLLTVDWHPFKPISFLMPLLSQYNSYRYKLEEIQQQVYTWSNDTDVLFVADFPGMHLDNYIAKNFTNVTLTVLEGQVTYSDEQQLKGVILSKESSISIKTGQFHRVKTTSAYPACYMYTYTNRDKQESDTDGAIDELKEPVSISTEILYRIENWVRAMNHIANAFFYLVYNVPMVQRVNINVT
ncbi:vitamin K-dependent gamma-carboxylase [Hylaeus volcanicus]|uniref:vitamin K-dependent gamma-carboxylase n=1 Tax=Hylaeus volcanicus TaxID=313075 RepID=UPI0023B7F841|nr:vitamin K-dependent gamma-carboxylase [Hylaeus volcanicus]